MPAIPSLRIGAFTVVLAVCAASCSASAPEPDSAAGPVESEQAAAGETPSDDVSGAPADEVSQAAVSPDTTTTTIPAEPTAYELALERFSGQRERATVDRPDEHDGPMVKFLYVVPSFATDRQRDTSGDIARYVFHMNEWLASQNGGFGVRVDTFEGALDVPFTTIETTPEEWNSWFGESLAPAAERLISQGWPIGRGVETNGDDLYFVVWEAFGGDYAKTGVSYGGCRGVIDGTNAEYRMVGFAGADADGEPCALDFGRFPFSGSTELQQSYLATNGAPPTAFIDHTMQVMRALPQCGYSTAPFAGELYTLPGTDIVEVRDGFIRDLLEDHDPLAQRMGEALPNATPALDIRHNTFFHITTGPNAHPGCNSDAGRHPMWSDTPFYDNSPKVPRRTVLDRLDDVAGRQLHAVYVKAVDAPDRALDTGLEIAAAVRDLDAWLREETGGVGVRLDTFRGHVDVTYLPLPMTMNEFVEAQSCLDERCPSDVDFERILIDAGYHDPEKTYAFFYDGGISPAGLCGGARNFSRSLLINLDDFRGTTCLPWRTEILNVYSLGLLVGHELMHSLGAVCQSSARSDEGYHSTFPSDFMLGGASGPGQRLDPNRDTYWGPGAPPGCDVSTDGIFTTEANLEPLNGTTLDSVPIGFHNMQPSERTWWLNPSDVIATFSPEESEEQSASSESSPDPSSYPSGLMVSTECNESGGATAVTFTGRLSGGEVADQQVAVIWVTETNGRCIAASTTSSDSGEFTLELPEEAHRTAAWEDGGGYCVVWDANGDGVFDSAGEPLDCISHLAVGQTINWTLRP